MRMLTVTNPFTFSLPDGRTLAQATYDGDWNTRTVTEEPRTRWDRPITYHFAMSALPGGVLALTPRAFQQLQWVEAHRCTASSKAPQAWQPLPTPWEVTVEKPYVESPAFEMPTLSAALHALRMQHLDAEPHVDSPAREMPTLSKMIRMVVGEFDANLGPAS